MILLDAATMASVTGGTWVGTPAGRIEGVAIDTRNDLSGTMFAAVRGTRDGHDYLPQATDALAAIVETRADIPLAQLVVPCVRDALAALARAQRVALGRVPVVGITGSAGKTTTRQMLEGVLRTLGTGTASPGSFNNELGVPITLLGAHATDRWVICELGTSAPGEIAHLGSIVRPTVVIITGTGRAHLAGFGSEEAIAKEKMALLDEMAPDGKAFVNIDRPFVKPYVRDDVVTFGVHPDARVRLTARTPVDGGQEIEINRSFHARLQFAGEHNAINAVGVVAVARTFGLSDDAIAAALAERTPPRMRLERQAIGPLCVWNDAYNANPESMSAALNAFCEMEEGDGRLVVIFGAMNELGEASEALHREVGRRIASKPIDHLVVVGETAHGILAGAEEAHFAGTTEYVLTCEEAAACCCDGDRVLIKASRGERLERVVEFLKERMGVTR